MGWRWSQGLGAPEARQIARQSRRRDRKWPEVRREENSRLILRSICVVLAVYLDERLQVCRELIDCMNRLRRTDWNASPAIDTTGWINVELGGILKTRFAFLRVNAVGRTN